ncbi:MAG: glycine cleavage system protein GcvH [Ilumatobacteraceae bacterium]
MSDTGELLYSKDHEWIRIVGGVARVGITDFAQDALGDVVFLQPPRLGDAVRSGDSLGEVESTKSVSDIYAPVSGTIVSVNTELLDNPALINSDPFGAGWICEIEVGADVDLSDLMDEGSYRQLVQGS